MKRKNLTTLIFPIAALLLEILPCGVIMHFAAPPDESDPFTVRTSYFDLLPLGYADAAPLVTAVLTCVLLAAMILYVIKSSRGWLMAVRILSLIAAAISLGPVLFSSYSPVGGLITVSLPAEFIWLMSRKPADAEN